MNTVARKVVCDAPRAERGLVLAALGSCIAEDLPDLRRLVWLVSGDWRRAAIRKRIADLEAEATRP